jgi:hypothetical protein
MATCRLARKRLNRCALTSALECGQLSEAAARGEDVYGFTSRGTRHFWEFRCPDCGSTDGVRSRRRTAWEKYVLPPFMLQPVRCADCFRRFYGPLWLRVRDRAESERKAPELPINANSQPRNRVA